MEWWLTDSGRHPTLRSDADFCYVFRLFPQTTGRRKEETMAQLGKKRGKKRTCSTAPSTAAKAETTSSPNDWTDDERDRVVKFLEVSAKLMRQGRWAELRQLGILEQNAGRSLPVIDKFLNRILDEPERVRPRK